MKKLLAAAACAAILAAPLVMAPGVSSAAPRGGFHGGYGFRGGYGGFGGGYYGWGGLGYGWGYPAAFGLGAALWDPWYSAYPGYYYAYAPAPYYYGYGYAPPPAGAAQPGAAPATGQGPQTGAACGNWNWDTAQSKYDWIPCAPPAPR